MFLSGVLASWGTSATVTGRVELKDSRDPAVRKKMDYSGVVISLQPASPAIPLRSSTARARMLQKDKTFKPHVLAVTVGTTVDFPNSDPIFHNAFSSYNGQIFDVGLYPPGTSRAVHFTREGVVRIFCNIHPSMSAVIVVTGTPYFDTTDRSGMFEIPAVPPGEYRMRVFHERASDAALMRLEKPVTVAAAGLQLPVISISESGYLPIPHKNKFGREYGKETDERTIYPAVKK